MEEKLIYSWGIIPETDLEKIIITSQEFFEGASFGNKIKIHPEGPIGIHIKQIMDFIDAQSWTKYRHDLRLIALLHDLGKHRVIYSSNAHVVGKGHSALSVEIAQKFLQDEEILKIIGVHDKYFHFLTDFKRGKFKEDKFLDTYRQLDLDRLIRFNYADSNNREKDSVKWFEDICVCLGLRTDKVYEKEPGVLNGN